MFRKMARNNLVFITFLITLAILLLISGCSKSEDVATITEGPPRIPHTTDAIDNCLACHETGLMGKAPITPHPERPSCTACHMPKEL